MKLKPNPLKYVVLLATSAAFVAAGLHLLAEHPIVGWLNITFFGFGAIVFAANLVPGSSFLCLDSDGMTIRSLYRTWNVRWLDTSEFFVTRIGGRQMVCWNYSPTFAGLKRSRIFSRSLTGVEAGLPDTYGRSGKELAMLLNQWRAQNVVRA